MEKRLLTIGETADQLGLGRSATYLLVLGGRIRSLKIGRARRVPVEAIDEFIEREERANEAPSDE